MEWREDRLGLIVADVTWCFDWDVRVSVDVWRSTSLSLWRERRALVRGMVGRKVAVESR